MLCALGTTTGCMLTNRDTNMAVVEASMTVTPDVVPADGITRAAVSVVLNMSGPTIPEGLGVTLSSDWPNAALDQPAAPGNNQDTFVGFLTSNVAGTQNLTARLYWNGGGMPLPIGAPVVFVDPNDDILSVPSFSMSSLSASPNELTADGASNSNLTLVARNFLGNALPNRPVTLHSSGTSNVFTPLQGVTDANGVFLSALRSTKAERKNVVATVSTVDLVTSVDISATVLFDAGPVSLINTSSSAGPTNGVAVANGNSPVVLTVVVEDAYGNPVPDQSVTLSDGAGYSYAPVSGVTDANGVFVTAITSTAATTTNVTTSIDGGIITLTTPVTFVPGPPVAAHCNFTVAPSTVVADGASTTTLTVVLRDAFNNVLVDSPVSVSSSGSNNLFAPSSGTTDGTGTFVATLASTKAETKALLATASGVFLGNSATFIAGAPSSSTTTTTPSAGSVAADGTTPDTIVVTVTDAYGNPIAGQTVTFSSGGSNVTLTSTSGVTDANGQVSTRATSTVVQNTSVTADVGGQFTQSASISFVPGAPSGNTTLAASPTTVTADGASSTTLTLTVLDAQGHPVPNEAVTLTSSGTANNLAPSSGTTNGSGVLTATLASTVAEVKTITARAGSVQASAVVTFVAGAPSSVTTTLGVSPAAVTADGSSASTLTVTVQDAHGNAVQGQSVTLSVSGANNTLSSNAGNTASNGTFAATLTSTKAETKTITATIGTIVLTQTVTFFSGPASSTTSMVSATPGSVTADGTSTTSVVVTVVDAHNNPVSGQSVSLAASGTGNSFASNAGSTNSSGQFTTTLSSTTAETKTITATIGAFNVTTSVTFVAGTPSNTTSTCVASPTTVTADGASTSHLKVTVQDAHGNPISGQAVSLSSTGSNNVFTPLSGTTNSVGVFTATVSSTAAEVKTLTATVGSVDLTSAVTFIAGSPNTTNSAFVANPTSVVANGSSTSTLTLTLLDAHNNPVASQAVTITGTGSNNTITPASGNTSPSGVFTATVSSTFAESKTFTATAGSVVKTATVVFSPGPPASTTTTFVVNPNSVTANGNSAMTLTVTAEDAHNNPIQGQAVTFSAGGSNNVFSATTGATGSGGVFSATLTSTHAQTETLTLTTGGVTKNATVTFTPGPPANGTTAVAVTSPTVTADGTSTTNVVVTVEDAYGNPVPSQSVSLSSTGSNNTLAPPSGTTGPTGTFTATMASTRAESKTITATAGSAQATTSVTFVAGSPNTLMSSFVASPNTVAADGTSVSTLTTTVLDAFGNPVAGQAVVLTSTGTNNVLNPNSGTTNSAGMMVATLASTTVETKVVTSTAGSIVKNANVVFTVPNVSAGNSNILANPNSLVANGIATTTITVTVRDGSNNPVPSQTVNFSSTGSNNTFSQLSAVTDPAGNVSVTLASTKAETKSVTALVDGTAINTNVTFVAGSPNSVKSSLVASPTTVTADGATPSTLSVLVMDAFGNPVSGQAVTLNSNGTGNTMTPSASGNTDSTGTFTAQLKSTVAQVKTVTASVGGSFNEVATVTFVAGGASATTTTFTASSTSLVANGASTTTLTVTVEDAQGNPVVGQAVSLVSTGSNNTLTPPGGPTNASGVFTATMSSTTAEVKTLTATAGAVNKTAVVTFTAGAPSNTTSTLAVNPNSLVANGSATTTMTFTVDDAQGNPVSGLSVSLVSSGTGNAWGTNGSSGLTDASGRFTTTLSSTVAQTKTITGTAGSMNETANVTFVAGPASQSNTTLVASPTTVTANGNNITTLTATVDDAFGNPVQGQMVTFTVSGTSNTLTPTSGPTNSTGVVTATLSSATAEVKTATASTAGYQQTASVTFVAGPPSSLTTTFVASPTSLTADNVTTSALTVTVKDANNNPVVGQLVSLSGTGSNNTFTPLSGNTNNLGQFTATLASKTAQTETITATIGAVTKNQNVTFTAGAASNATSTVSPSPSIVTADGTHSTTITVTVLDAQGNPISAQTVSLAIGGSGNSTGSLSGSTNALGQWSTTLSSTVAENKSLTATIGSFNVSNSVSFVPGAVSNTTSSLVASLTSLVADNSTTTQLTVTVKDAQGNPINGQAVTLAGSGTNNTFNPASGNTNSSGVMTATLASSKAQVETITATIGSVNETATVTFVAGSPNSTTSTITVNPNSVAANGTATTLVTVTVEDAFGNLISGQAVTLNANGTGNVFSAPSGNTNALGQWTSTLSSTTSQTETVTATVGAMTLNTVMTFSPTTPTLAKCTFIANPNSVTADGVSTSTLTVTVNDASGNPINAQPVTFSSSGTSSTWPLGTTGTTNASGIASVTLATTKAQAETATVKFAGLTMNANVTFVPGNPNKLVFTTSPTSTNSSFGTCPLSPNAVVTITDAQGNAVSTATNSITLTLSTNPSGATLGGTATVSAVGGVATFPGITVSKPASGYKLTASATGLSSATSTSFNAMKSCATQTSSTSVGVTGISCISSGDFDKDGNLDVAVSAGASKTIKILYGNGTGAFGSRTFTVTAGAAFSNIVTPDFNGDGYADLAIGNPGAGSNAGVVYLNNTTGGFGAATAVGLGANTNNLAAIDVNNDGHIDLVGAGSSSLTWVINNGSGGFGAATSKALTGPVWSPWAQNGNYGYVTGSGSTFTGGLVVNGTTHLSSTYGQGDNPTTYTAATNFAGNTFFQTVLDVNFGQLLSICTNSSGSTYTQNFPSGTANGYFIGTADALNTGGVQTLLIAEDGAAEIMTLDSGCGTSLGTVYNTGHNTIWITIGDFNNDGIIDLATANYDNNSVTAILVP